MLNKVYKKTQISVFLIIGILILLFSILVFSFYSEKKQTVYQKGILESNQGLYSQGYIRAYITTCIRETAVKAMEETGIREETKEAFETIISQGVKECTSDLLTRLKNQNYNIQEKEIFSQIEIDEETVLIKVNYPLIIENENQRIEIDSVEVMFDLTTSEKISGGITKKETIIVSGDGKAELIIPEGIKITDKEGNPVERISLKLKDLHFDGLNNGVVLGNTIYEALPDGVVFSEPVKLSLEFRQEDLNGRDINLVRVAWWNEDYEIWSALQTSIEGNRAIAEISHFTEYSTALVDGIYSINLPVIFEQRYLYCPEGDKCKCDTEDDWFVSLNKEDNGKTQILRKKNEEDYQQSKEVNDIIKKLVETGVKVDYGYFEYNPDYLALQNELMEQGRYISDDLPIKKFDFHSCIEEEVMPEECINRDEDNKFIIPFGYFKTDISCDFLIGDVTGWEQLEIEPNKYYPGNLYNFQKDSSLYTFLLTIQGVINQKLICEMLDVTMIDEKSSILGYCDSRCVGGQIISETEDKYVANVVFRPKGDAIISETPPISVSPICGSNRDFCLILPYESGQEYVLIREEGLEIRVRGLGVNNQNKDACASVGVLIYFEGGGVSTYGTGNTMY